jgi:hypothetical protein
MKTMTVLRSAHCRAQTKRIRRDPQSGQLVKRGFSKEWLYHRREHPIHSFDELAELLGKLSADPYCAVVRGASIPGAPNPGVRRSHPDPVKGTAPTLAPAARCAFGIDMDGIDQGLVDDPAIDPEGAIAYLLDLIPQHLGNVTEASCHWSFSSSQGLEPGKLHARIWFLNSRPLSDEELRRWAHAVNAAVGFKLVDPALYNPAQLHYVAAPILDGIDDPLPRRSGVRRGIVDEVDVVIPEPRAEPAGEETGYRQTVGFEAYLDAIGGEHGFNNAIFRAICSYVGTHGADGTDPTALRDRLSEAILAAPPGHRSQSEIERYASARYLDDEVRRVLARKRAEQQLQTLPDFGASRPDRDPALAEMHAEIATEIAAAGERIALRRELARRQEEARAAAAAPFGDPKELDEGRLRKRKAAMAKASRKAKREYLAELGLERMPPRAAILHTGSQGSGKSRAAAKALAGLKGGNVLVLVGRRVVAFAEVIQPPEPPLRIWEAQIADP